MIKFKVIEELLRESFQQGQQWMHDIHFNDNEPVNFNEWFKSPEVQQKVKDSIQAEILNLYPVTASKVEYAERQAFNVLDEWDDITGAFGRFTGYYDEVQGIVQDAVHIGIQVALYGEVKRDEDGEIKRNFNASNTGK